MTIAHAGKTLSAWILTLDASFPDRAALLREYGRLLGHDETLRSKQFWSEQAGVLYLAARVLLRTMLSRRVAGRERVAPWEWTFVSSARGKPTLAPPYDRTGLHFNVSHSERCVACAVTEGRELGVDVEAESPRIAIDRLAGYFLSESERADLAVTPPSTRRVRFFGYWTLKEAYLKARGDGLAYPVRAVSLRWNAAAERIDVSDAHDEEATARWAFSTFDALPGYHVALCWRRSEEKHEPEIRWRTMRTSDLARTARAFIDGDSGGDRVAMKRDSAARSDMDAGTERR